jgi:hypothetical protein
MIFFIWCLNAGGGLVLAMRLERARTPKVLAVTVNERVVAAMTRRSAHPFRSGG